VVNKYMKMEDVVWKARERSRFGRRVGESASGSKPQLARTSSTKRGGAFHDQNKQEWNL